MTDQTNFHSQLFVAVSGSPGGKVPNVDDVLSFHEQEVCPTTSFDENNSKSEFQTDRNVYKVLRQTYLALKIKLVKGRGFILTKQQKKKEHREDNVITEKGNNDVQFVEEEGERVPHFIHVKNFQNYIDR